MAANTNQTVFQAFQKAYTAIKKVKAVPHYPPRWRFSSFQGSVGSQANNSRESRTRKQAKCVPWINNGRRGKVIWERRIWLPLPWSTSVYIVVVLFPSLSFPGYGWEQETVLGRLGASKWSRNRQRSFGLDGRKREQYQKRHGRCSPATVQPKNIRIGNRKMPGPLL